MTKEMADLCGFGSGVAVGPHPFTKPLHYRCANPANIGNPRLSADFRPRGKREKRGRHRFPTAQRVAQSVRPTFSEPTS
jgi:hypothetical protein